jgi:SAM-dependent methyltransferase
MDTRIKDLVACERREMLDREYSLVEEARASLRGNGHRLVDIGCGPFGLLGRNGDRLAGLRAGSIGVDIDMAGLARNSNVAHRVCASLYSLPLETNSVDFIVCRWVFEHLEEPGSALNEFYRVLRDGGFVYIKTPNLWNYGMLLSRITPTSFHNLFRSATGIAENIPTFYRANTKRKLTELAACSGLQVRKLEAYSYSYMYYAFNKELFLMMRTVSRLGGKATHSMQQVLLCLMQKA